MTSLPISFDSSALPRTTPTTAQTRFAIEHGSARRRVKEPHCGGSEDNARENK